MPCRSPSPGEGRRDRHHEDRLTSAASVDGGMCSFTGVSDFFTERKLMLYSQLLGIPVFRSGRAAKGSGGSVDTVDSLVSQQAAFTACARIFLEKPIGGTKLALHEPRANLYALAPCRAALGRWTQV